MTRRTAVILAIIVVAWFPGACGPLEPGSRDRKGAESVELVSKSEGPVKLTVTSNTKQIEAGKVATLTLRVETDAGSTVQIADYAKMLENSENHFEYRVVQSRSKPPIKTPMGKIEWTNEYDVEFILAGDYELPGVSLTHTVATANDKGKSRQDEGIVGSTPPITEAQKPTEIQSDAIKLSVREATIGGMAPEELQKIPKLSPVELPSPWRIWRWAIAAAGLAALILVLVWYRRWNKKRAEEVIIIPAHEWARLQIAGLLVDDLLARGLFQEFYYRVSDIVRGYIERRFSVAAPEMTTEEFLLSLAKDRRFGEKDRSELNEFMNACDIVKYARHQPTAAEANAMLDAATNYIERTRERLYQPRDRSGYADELREQAA